MKLLARILSAPRPVMRWILDHRPRGAVLIVVLAFISSSLKEFDPRGIMKASEALGNAGALAISALGVILGSALAVALYFGLSWMATMTGRFMGGTGDFWSVRQAMAWGCAPVVWALVYRIPAMVFWPDAFMKKESAHLPEIVLTAPFDAPLYQIIIIGVLELIVLVGYFVVASQTLAEAHGITGLSGFASLLAAYVLPLIAIVAVGGAAYLAFR